MFAMTSDIQIGGYAVKPLSVKWRTSVLSVAETCSIVLPRVVYLKNELDTTDDYAAKKKVPVFNEGDAVSVSLGYNGNNTLRFKGFVKEINQTEKLELECEGHSYLLPKVFSKSYASTTVREILTELVEGTNIRIADNMIDMNVQNARLTNLTGLQVVEWIQKELHLAVYFDFDTLYAGTLHGGQKEEVPLQLGWNTVDDKDFRKRKKMTGAPIRLVYKDSGGVLQKVKAEQARPGEVKDVKVKAGLSSKDLQLIANDLQTREYGKGCESKVVCFLEPEIQKGSLVNVTDKRFPERSGIFFTETVEGSFSSSGGRQSVTINYF